MDNGENRRNGPQFRSAPLITSAAMVGAGTLIVLTGLAIGGGHLLASTRQWINEMEVPPSELARLKWTQARSAMLSTTPVRRAKLPGSMWGLNTPLSAV